MNKRLLMLQKLTSAPEADAFAWYALAMEYRKEDRAEEALSAFATLRMNSPDYLPMYLMAGQLLIQCDRREEARSWLEAGIELAKRQGDTKAVGELQAELANTE